MKIVFLKVVFVRQVAERYAFIGPVIEVCGGIHTDSSVHGAVAVRLVFSVPVPFRYPVMRKLLYLAAVCLDGRSVLIEPHLPVGTGKAGITDGVLLRLKTVILSSQFF